MPKLAEDQALGASNAQRRLRGLLKANRLVVEHLDLPTVLHQIVVASVDLVGAATGAIGIRGPDGTLEDFVQVGTKPETAEVMNSFLGVPLRVRDEVFGHLHLSDPRVDAFSDDDRELLQALAATAGVAIAHARLFEDSMRREKWTAASTQVTHELLTNDDVDALQVIAERLLLLAEADLVAVVVSEATVEHAGDRLTVSRAAGPRGGAVLGMVLPHGDTLVRRCLATGRAQMLGEIGANTATSRLPHGALGPAMALPLLAEGGVRGSLFVMRDVGAARFTEFDLQVAASFAGKAALALERVDTRAARARTETLEDRDRIARDLHDHVIQRLFATGLSIQSICGALGPGAITDRLGAQIDEIDATIRQIRSTIFGLHVLRDHSSSARSQILQVIEATRVTLHCPLDVDFRGPVDLLVSASLCEQVVAVVREALTNVGRHAAADRAQVRVAVDPRSLTVEVTDDGVGMSEDVTCSGLDNLRKRAETLSGSLVIEARNPSGTRLVWQVPIAVADRS